jgi:hypothetical protein
MATWRVGAPLLRDGLTAQLFKWGAEETEAIIERALRTETVMLNLVGVELWARIFLRGESTEQLGDTLLDLQASRTNGRARHAMVAS